ncbi:MAG: Uma2 family endonuclease [Ardenticatenaceae bacterium]|nr:Uma2 family endonuclease [Ardenticatenaceae bacterium]
MTYEEFLNLADEDLPAEWVDGEVIVTSLARDRHQDIVRFLTAVLSVFVETHEPGAVRPAPFQMKLAQEHLDRLKATYLDGPADLVIEITSPESVGRDRGEKFYEYEQANIPQYWLIDPERKRAEFYRLDENGQYQLAPQEAGVSRSRVLEGFWLRADWLWQTPPVLEALRALELV